MIAHSRIAPVEASSTNHYDFTAAAAIIALALLVAVHTLVDRGSLLDNGRETARQIAEQTALAADGTLDSTRQLLRAMSVLVNSPSIPAKPDPAAVDATLRAWKADGAYVMDLLVIDADGRIRHWTGDGEPPDIRDRDYYAAHVRTPRNGVYLGPPQLSKVHAGQWFFAVSEALRDERGALTGIVVVIVDVAALRDRLGVRLAIAQSTQALLSAEGQVYVRMPDHARHVGKTVSRPRELAMITAAAPAATFTRTSQLDGKERILSFRRLSGYPLIAAGTIDVDTLLAPWRQRLAIALGLWLLLSVGVVWIAVRLKATSRMQAELANIDGLTGIHNRRSILSAATLLERSNRSAGRLSILMIDVDHFKSINDRFGHAAGDELLRRTAEILRARIRSTDIAGRYGGEEFLVLMPDTEPDGAAGVAEELRVAVAAELTRPAPVTISIGVAATSETDPTIDRTLARADAALYAAKAAGRNCVRVAPAGGVIDAQVGGVPVPAPEGG